MNAVFRRTIPRAIISLLSTTLLSIVPVPDANIHRVTGEGEPDKAAKNYEEDRAKIFRQPRS